MGNFVSGGSENTESVDLPPPSPGSAKQEGGSASLVFQAARHVQLPESQGESPYVDYAVILEVRVVNAAQRSCGGPGQMCALAIQKVKCTALC